MLPARLTPSPADLAFCLPPFVLSLSSPCHGICTAWGLPQPPHVAELVPCSREDLWQLLMFLDLPRTYLNPTDKPWPSEQPSAEFELVCSECRWDFPVKATSLASPASLFPPHLLRCSVEQWLWHSSQAIPTPQSCSWLSEVSFHQLITIHLSRLWLFPFCIQGELGKRSGHPPKLKLCSTEKFSYMSHHC